MEQLKRTDLSVPDTSKIGNFFYFMKYKLQNLYKILRDSFKKNKRRLLTAVFLVYINGLVRGVSFTLESHAENKIRG